MARTRAERRHLSIKKALRKRAIVKTSYWVWEDTASEYYNNLHQYSKNKIHCSCPLCRRKTNTRKYRLWGTSKNWKHSDLIKLERLKEEKLLWQES